MTQAFRSLVEYQVDCLKFEEGRGACGFMKSSDQLAFEFANQRFSEFSFNRDNNWYSDCFQLLISLGVFS